MRHIDGQAKGPSEEEKVMLHVYPLHVDGPKRATSTDPAPGSASINVLISFAVASAFTRTRLRAKSAVKHEVLSRRDFK
eukprot:CAMPEP_0172433908 /NCGR_PEP_ID=MMETSP1064-20121228/70142_1 /TAXON_ID=202472 /ORGANISM="Aulacoseira subarctica , Strain CCAP 1002/5" /LENGTH=78 /DNA_ID=CAMNT_0013182067 /DNA_START=214 /DNA_END=450 /DNA_ORIENTATION=+